MILQFYFWIRSVLSLFLLICAYLYSIRIYGTKVTSVTSLLITSFFIVIFLSGAYSSVPLGTDLPFYNTIGPFFDMVGIFPSFLITFELGRYALGKTNERYLTRKDIVSVALLVSFFGFCFQMALDISAAGLGLYFYTNPPPMNIFGYPVLFLLSFTIYGLWGGIFLFFERKFRAL